MPELFQNKYRIASARWQMWNYASEGMYYFTICTRKKVHFFGEIPSSPYQDAEVQLSEIGKIAELQWYDTPRLRPDMNLELGEFVVMPNHVHGIVIVGENTYNADENKDANGIDAPGNFFGPQRKNLSSIIRGYKGAVTAYARHNQIEFDWQPRFHDRVIRSMEEFERISNYIRNNPANWREDEFYQKSEKHGNL